MTALFRKVDCLSLPVTDLDAALAFYSAKLGHELIWRSRTAAGGRVLAGPFEIQIGLGAVVADPWGNVLVLLDSSKGLLRVDENKRVIDSD